MTPERLWLLSIRLRVAGWPRLAGKVKQLNSLLFHNSLATGASVSSDIYLGHHGLGTVINDHVTIGQRVKIWHNVTLAVRAPMSVAHRIVIEDGVMIGTGATIITPRSQCLRIGRNAKIGAGAVVTRDVPADSTAVGVPARVVPHRNGPSQ